MSKKTIIIIIIIVLLLCSCITISGVVVGYFYYKSKSDNDNSTTEEKDNDTDDSDKDEDSDEDDDNDSTSQLIYYNSKYGFSLILEPGWEDYDTDEVAGSDYAGFVHYYDFSLLSESENTYITLFTIMIYTDEQWQGILASGALDFTGEEKLGESGGYVFTFSHINANPPSDLQTRMLDFENIKDSFELDS